MNKIDYFNDLDRLLTEIRLNSKYTRSDAKTINLRTTQLFKSDDLFTARFNLAHALINRPDYRNQESMQQEVKALIQDLLFTLYQGFTSTQREDLALSEDSRIYIHYRLNS